MQSIIHFVKYSNGFPILLGILFLGAGSTFASEKVRDAVIGETIEETIGMDNTALLELDIRDIPQKMRIVSVTEDTEYYFVSYTFATFDITDNVWQEVTKADVLKISKVALGGTRDLGLYVQSEFGQLMDSQRVYLAESKVREEKRGKSKLIKTTKYTGLKGLVLDPKTKTFDGYKPVIKEFKRKDAPYIPPDVIDTEVLVNHENDTAPVVPNIAPSEPIASSTPSEDVVVAEDGDEGNEISIEPTPGPTPEPTPEPTPQVDEVLPAPEEESTGSGGAGGTEILIETTPTEPVPEEPVIEESAPEAIIEVVPSV